MKSTGYEIDKDRLLNELNTIGKYIISNDVNHYKYNINGFMNFNYAATNLCGMAVNLQLIELYKPNIFNNQIKYQKKQVDNFFEFLCKNRDLLIETFNNTKEFFDKEINFDQIDYYDCFKKYNKDDFENIILDFYSEYGNKYYSIAKKYFDENRIQTNYDTKDFLGMYIYSLIVSSGYIFCGEDKKDSRLQATIVHELGHAINAETFMFPQQKVLGITEDACSEIPSTCFENLFSQSLIDKKIDYTGGLLLTNQFYSQIFNSSIVNSMFLPLEEYAYDDECNLYYSASNENEEESSINKYPIRDSIIYGIGHLFALHFNYLDKKDKDKFLQVYNDIITGRKESQLSDLINMLGINENDFSNLKYVKENIKDNNMKLRKRFHYND